MPRNADSKFKKRYILWIVLLVGPAAFVCFRVYAYHQLNARIEAISQQGFPMTLAELDVWYREGFPEDLDNYWNLYADAFSDYFEWSER